MVTHEKNQEECLKRRFINPLSPMMSDYSSCQCSCPNGADDNIVIELSEIQEEPYPNPDTYIST